MRGWMKSTATVSILHGHMEKQETEMKWKLEMETGNGNWKQKWEQKTYQSLVQYFHYSTSCNLTMRVTYFILEQGKHFYSCSLVPRPTFSLITCSVCSKLWLHTQALGTIAQILANAEILVF